MAFSITPKIELQCPPLKVKTIESRPEYVHALTSGGNVWRGNTVPQPLQLSAANAWPDVMSLPLWQPVACDTCRGETEGERPSGSETRIRKNQLAQAERTLDPHGDDHRNTDSTEQPVDPPVDNNNTNNSPTTERKPAKNKTRSRRKKKLRDGSTPGEPTDDANEDGKCSDVNVDGQRGSLNNVAQPHPEILNFSFGSMLVLPTMERNVINSVATADGTIRIALRDGASAEITIDGGVRINSATARCVLAINARRSTLAVIHAVGRVFQEDDDIGIITHVPIANKRYVSFMRKGVTFTSDRCAQTYLLDEGGVRTLHKRVCAKMLATDFSWSVLYDGSRHGADHIADAISLLARRATYSIDQRGKEWWRVGEVVVTQDKEGNIRVQNDRKTFQLATSLVTGDTFVNAPGVHCTVADRDKPALFVSRRQIKVTYTRNDNQLLVRNGTSSAVYTADGKLTIH